MTTKALRRGRRCDDTCGERAEGGAVTIRAASAAVVLAVACGGAGLHDHPTPGSSATPSAASVAGAPSGAAPPASVSAPHFGRAAPGASRDVRAERSRPARRERASRRRSRPSPASPTHAPSSSRREPRRRGRRGRDVVRALGSAPPATAARDAHRSRAHRTRHEPSCFAAPRRRTPRHRRHRRRMRHLRRIRRCSTPFRASPPRSATATTTTPNASCALRLALGEPCATPPRRARSARAPRGGGLASRTRRSSRCSTPPLAATRPVPGALQAFTRLSQLDDTVRSAASTTWPAPSSAAAAPSRTLAIRRARQRR